MSNQAVVSMENIHKKYVGSEIETHALQGVSLNIYSGEFVAITKPVWLRKIHTTYHHGAA